jgi:hypothetical protein
MRLRQSLLTDLPRFAAIIRMNENIPTAQIYEVERYSTFLTLLKSRSNVATG